MVHPSPRRRTSLRILLAAGSAFCGWALLLSLTGGLDTTIAGLRVQTTNPFRPLLFGAAAWSWYLLIGGTTPSWLVRGRRLATIGAEVFVSGVVRPAARVLRAHPHVLVPAVIVLTFLPALSSAVVPAHDALQVYTAFWTYISGLTNEGRLPEWIPIGRYGTPSGPILMYVTPTALVMGAGGALLHAVAGLRDTLLLFKLTVAVEYAIFAAGVLRFGRLLYQSRWIGYGVAALGILSSPWIVSLDGNFHLFYMTPWILASLARAWQTGTPRHLGTAALLAVFACVGNVPYFAPFLLLQLTVFSIPLLLAQPRDGARLLMRPATWLWLAGAGALFAVHLIVLVKGMEGLAILSPGRDPVTNHVPKEVFLTYAGVAKPVRILGEWLTGRTINGDNTFYMGLATLGLVPLSLFIGRSPVLRAVQGLALFLALFSTGGLVASASYYFPGMVFYRHVSIVFGPLRLLAFFCAGAVLDRLVTDPSVFTRWRPWPWLRRRGLVAALLAVFIAAELWRAEAHGPDFELALFGDAAASPVVVGVRLAVYALGGLLLLLARPVRPRRALAYLLMAALVADLGTFWAAGWMQWPRLDAAQAQTMAAIAAPRPLPAFEARVTHDMLPARGAALMFLRDTPPLSLSQRYVHLYLLAGVDPCVPELRTDFIAAPMARLFARRGVDVSFDEHTESRVLADPWLARVLGCHAPPITSSAGIVAVARGYDWFRLSVANHEPAPARITLSEAIMPGWTAAIDGRPAPVIAEDDALLAADVPPGTHEVTFRFHQPIAGPVRVLEVLLAILGALALMTAAWRSLSGRRGAGTL